MNRAPVSTGLVILSVSDDEDARARRSGRLAEVGHHVLDARDVDGALELLRGELPDLILLDCGTETELCIAGCRKVRAAAPTARLLSLVPGVDRETMVALFEAGADAVVAAVDEDTILAAARAVARRTSVEAALAQGEERFRTLADNIPVLCWMCNPDGWIFWYNQRWYDYTGTSPEGMQGWGWRSVHHPDHVDRVVEHFRRSIEKGEEWEDTFPLRGRDGQYRWFLSRATPNRDSSGAIVRWFGSNVDVTPQREAERALRESEDRLRLATEAAAIGTWDWNLETGKLRWDARCKALFGLSPEAEVTYETTFLAALHPADREGTVAAVDAALAPDGPGEYHVEYRTIGLEDGVERWLAANGRAFMSGGRRVRFVGTVLDISERKRTEAALRDLTATLEQRVLQAVAEREQAEEALRQAQKMEAVGQLTGGVAHDFNNLLTVITGNMDMALRTLGTGGDPRVRRAVENAIRGAERAAALTQRLLAFARRQPLAPQPTDVNRLISSMSDLLARSLGETVEIETVLAGGLWKVEVDQNQLESAILNLAVNARDAMDGTGKLTIETANARLDPAYAAANTGVSPGQYAVIAVSDTGSGMSPATLERVFEPFFTTKQPGQGTGLGLSQVYGFVKQSGGHVKIYSEVGEGTTVRIYLPRLLRETGGEEEAPSEAAADGSVGESILVVEDDVDVRAYTTEMLRELGYTVLEAQDGATALRLLERRAEPVNLLLTDVVMPGMNGRELVEQARRLCPGLRVLFTTGYARDAIVHQGRLDPSVDLLPKPFTYASLSTRVRDALDRAGIARVLLCDGGHLSPGLREAGFTVDPVPEVGVLLFRLKLGAVAADAVILDAEGAATDAGALVAEMRAWQQDLPILLLAARSAAELEARYANDSCVAVIPKPVQVQVVVDRLHALGLRCRAAADPA